MRLYSYIVTCDTGFSPNPFWGWCTLADCKPKIRLTAKVGDWVVGLSPKADGNRLIFAMQVEEIVPYHRYYSDIRFVAKVPDYSFGKVVYKCGDNIYKPLPNGDFQQLQSTHSNGANENLKTKAHDLGGKNVLISRTFYYFGSRPLDLLKSLDGLKVGRGHKCIFPPDIVSAFIAFITRQTAGVSAPPTYWPHNDDSWKTVGT
jgi:Nucleotide modification associated domain 2